MNSIIEKKIDKLSDFRKDVIAGLSAEKKRISSKYFYDEKGDAIFQRIMAAPEYYLTRAENEILRSNAMSILQCLAQDAADFDIIELGAGDGTKTKHLLRQAISEGRKPTYRPVDISENILNELGEALTTEIPELNYKALQGEYFGVFERQDLKGGQKKCILFLGSNIGNLDRTDAVELLTRMKKTLNTSDRILVGFDLKKDPQTVLAAYNDAEGATRDFNLNLLHRINSELGGNIDVNKFRHVPVYDPFEGRALSYLMATEDINITISGCDEVFPVRAWEAIHLEVSQKYDEHSIRSIGSSAGLEIVELFTDPEKRYMNVVFKNSGE